MSDMHDDNIDALLRRSFDGSVPDGGFSDKVMQHLPSRRRRSIWPLWSGILAGIGGGALSLLRASVLAEGLRDWLRGEWASTPAMVLLLAMAGMTLLACWWGAAEAER